VFNPSRLDHTEYHNYSVLGLIFTFSRTLSCTSAIHYTRMCANTTQSGKKDYK